MTRRDGRKEKGMKNEMRGFSFFSMIVILSKYVILGKNEIDERQG